MTTATEIELKPVRLEVPKDLHRVLRVLAALDGVSMAMFVRAAIEEKVQEESRRRGLK